MSDHPLGGVGTFEALGSKMTICASRQSPASTPSGRLITTLLTGPPKSDNRLAATNAIPAILPPKTKVGWATGVGAGVGVPTGVDGGGVGVEVGIGVVAVGPLPAAIIKIDCAVNTPVPVAVAE